MVYIVDDHCGVRDSLVALLKAARIAAATFAGADELLSALDHLEPGMFLIDVRMPGRNGLELLKEIRERYCYWPAAIMTGHGEIPIAVQSMKLGAMEFLEKPFSPDELEALVHSAMAQLPAAVSKSAQARAAHELLRALSPRQRQVFDGVLEGLTSKEIARQLGISHRTVESYRLDMMRRLGVGGLVELAQLGPMLRELGYDDSGLTGPAFR